MGLKSTMTKVEKSVDLNKISDLKINWWRLYNPRIKRKLNKEKLMQRNMRHSQVHEDMHNGSTIRKGEKGLEKLL